MKNLKPLLIPSLITFLALISSMMLSSFLLLPTAPILLFSIWSFGFPYLTLFVAARFKHVNSLPVAILGMFLSYGFWLFMTFKHFDTDFGLLFKITFLVNLVMIPLYWYLRKVVAENTPKLRL